MLILDFTCLHVHSILRKCILYFSWVDPGNCARLLYLFYRNRPGVHSELARVESLRVEFVYMDIPH